MSIIYHNSKDNNNKVIIAGSRSFEPDRNKLSANEYNLKLKQLDSLIDEVVELSGYNNTVNGITQIVSGYALGIDRAGERYAIRAELPFKFKRFRVIWTVNGVYNPLAGFERNNEMSIYGDKLIAVWDGQSGGTVDMIDRVRLINKPVFVHVPEWCYS